VFGYSDVFLYAVDSGSLGGEEWGRLAEKKNIRCICGTPAHSPDKTPTTIGS